MILPELEVGDVLYKNGEANFVVKSVKRGVKFDEPVYMIRSLDRYKTVLGPYPAEVLSADGYYVLEALSEKNLFIFKYKDSDQELLRTSANSQRQAIHLAGIRKGHDWIQDALETGLIHVDVADVEKAPLPKKKIKEVPIGPSCPNCSKSNSKTISTGETMCKNCGWIWDTRDESITQLIKKRSFTPLLYRSTR